MSEVGTSSVAVDARGTTRQLPLCLLLPYSLSLCLSQSFFLRFTLHLPPFLLLSSLPLTLSRALRDRDTDTAV